MTDPRDALIDAARDAARRAYAPYSGFHVGAALLLKNGDVVTGANVENASYGLSMCAERVALFSAVAQGKRPTALAVSCLDAQKGAPLGSRMPCGACRQVIHELLPRDGEIQIDGVGTRRVQELLPEGFQLTPDAI